MILWVLLISFTINTPVVAFKSHDDCREAASKLKVPAVCIAFAADIPEGKSL